MCSFLISLIILSTGNSIKLSTLSKILVSAADSDMFHLTSSVTLGIGGVAPVACASKSGSATVWSSFSLLINIGRYTEIPVGNENLTGFALRDPRQIGKLGDDNS
jgi:hypothetical protein